MEAVGKMCIFQQISAHTSTSEMVKDMTKVTVSH